MAGELGWLRDAPGVPIYRRRGRGYVAPPELSGSGARRRGALARRGQRFRAHVGTVKLEDEHRRRWEKIGAKVHYGFSRDMRVLATAASASASSGSITRWTSTRAQRRACRARCQSRVFTRSPCWHGKDDAHSMPNYVWGVLRAVLGLGRVMAHCQADQMRHELVSKFLVKNLVAKFGGLLEDD